MKNLTLSAFMSRVLLSLVTVSCKKDDDNVDVGGDENRFENTLKTGQVGFEEYANIAIVSDDVWIKQVGWIKINTDLRYAF
jgi:hypothetical protein